MTTNNYKRYINKDIEAVITSFNQGSMILEAVSSLCSQTTLPARIIIVDDGSTDENSINILNHIKSDTNIPIPVLIVQQQNRGVSAARNTGIKKTQSSMVLVLDGDDKLEPTFIEEVGKLLHSNSSMIAASSWMRTFGVLDAVVFPPGGDITSFLARNCCPATHIFKRKSWEQCGGYDEAMRTGFEDWNFFLSMLEAVPNTYIGIVKKPLINYRTAPASPNVKSMTKRLEIMRYIIEKHISVYRNHIIDAILGIESTSISRLYGWENEIVHTITTKQSLSQVSKEFIEHPSYGDGGMAAAVRISSSLK